MESSDRSDVWAFLDDQYRRDQRRAQRLANMPAWMWSVTLWSERRDWGKTFKVSLLGAAALLVLYALGMPVVRELERGRPAGDILMTLVGLLLCVSGVAAAVPFAAKGASHLGSSHDGVDVALVGLGIVLFGLGST